ncbi:hypothetical protein R3P38DRAFT_3495947 [Favolaschia claudopus]|uniref:Uncharacterized protein n=1 Tax=Favolaschia claudopus TaxID=2862362 RepID=A0AAV9Z5J0_9AGAR
MSTRWLSGLADPSVLSATSLSLQSPQRFMLVPPIRILSVRTGGTEGRDQRDVTHKDSTEIGALRVDLPRRVPRAEGLCANPQHTNKQRNNPNPNQGLNDDENELDDVLNVAIPIWVVIWPLRARDPPRKVNSEPTYYETEQLGRKEYLQCKRGQEDTKRTFTLTSHGTPLSAFAAARSTDAVRPSKYPACCGYGTVGPGADAD